MVPSHLRIRSRLRIVQSTADNVIVAVSVTVTMTIIILIGDLLSIRISGIISVYGLVEFSV